MYTTRRKKARKLLAVKASNLSWGYISSEIRLTDVSTKTNNPPAHHKKILVVPPSSAQTLILFLTSVWNRNTFANVYAATSKKSLALLALGFDFLFRCIVNENLIWCAWLGVPAALAPIIATCVSKQVTLLIESCARDCACDGTEGLESLFIVCKLIIHKSSKIGEKFEHDLQN